MSDCHRCGFLYVFRWWGRSGGLDKLALRWHGWPALFFPINIDQCISLTFRTCHKKGKAWLCQLNNVSWYFGEYMGDWGKDYPAQNMGIQDKPSARCGDLWCVLMVQAASCVQKTDECNKKSSPLPTVRRDWRCSSAGELSCDKLRLGWTKVNFMIWGKQLEQLECIPRIFQGYPNVAGLYVIVWLCLIYIQWFTIKDYILYISVHISYCIYIYKCLS